MRCQFLYAKRTFAGCLLILMASMAWNCGGDDSEGLNPPEQDGGADGGGSDASALTIRAIDNRFDPATLSIPLGTTVTWLNAGANLHTVTSGQNSSSPGAGSGFDAQLASGQTFSHTFNTPGDHPYFCRIHEAAGMTGIITVTP